jgi:hypothetical protein
MNHYSLEQWIDFVRGLADFETYAQMLAHKATCPWCAGEVSILAEAVALSTTDRSYEPPAHLVEAAERIFSPVPPAMLDRLGSRFLRLAAQVEWDSFGGAVPEGVRSLRPGARHVVYRAGRYSIDLILDMDFESDVIELTGQVADETSPDFMPGILQPILFAGSEVVSTTASTESGEFSLQYRPGRELSLWIPMEVSGECIEVPLPANAARSN